MKVSDSLGGPSSIPDINGKEERKITDSGETGFQARLKQVELRNCEERLKELVGMIAEQGKKLGEKTDIRELKTYKKLISEFMDETVGGSRKFSKHSFLDRRGRHRVYALVRKIDNELEQLTKDILEGEKNNIRILQRLEDIRGLILDIIM